ncbi:hypothetical protein [Mycobacterium deserti]|uniref:Transposase n=1 Tax=Mycobacterium deserti TaxID=2978347 RepID=A0ABT2M5W5_9MYCO|nr:hypothetical protein [Mycobacterium deserti]MCT7657311.1 hypothetical protein [Mycobacterium deserti]
MAGFSVLTDDDAARASDLAQAAYFRDALADHRSLIHAEIVRQTRALDALSTKSDAIAITRLRREIRANEAECRDLDRMIEALDQRFSVAGANRP